MIQFDGEYEKIILPKKLYDRNLNKFINYNEMFDQNYNKYRTEESYDLNDIDIIENNVDEIYQASVEMYHLVIKNEKIKFDQEEFYKIFNIYYDNPLVNKTKISNKFYLENKILFKKRKLKNMRKKEVFFMNENHKKTKRNYIERMINSKIKCMREAKKYERNYWDGPRKYGYGGYKYIPGRWTKVANKIINKFNLTNKSNILDIGCGKAFLLYEIKKNFTTNSNCGF